MTSEELRTKAEQYIELQLKTLAQHGSRSSVTNDTREDMILSAMRAAGYTSGSAATFPSSAEDA